MLKNKIKHFLININFLRGFHVKILKILKSFKNNDFYFFNIKNLLKACKHGILIKIRLFYGFVSIGYRLYPSDTSCIRRIQCVSERYTLYLKETNLNSTMNAIL